MYGQYRLCFEIQIITELSLTEKGDASLMNIECATGVPILDLPLSAPSSRQPRFITATPSVGLNLICPNLSLGGAERIVLELLISLARTSPVSEGQINLFLLR